MKTPTDKQLKDRELKDQERDLNRKIALVSREIKDNYPALIKWKEPKMMSTSANARGESVFHILLFKNL